jgi:carboxyl-terminal processing protease
VYGGGGIMPDVFIPWDSTPITDYYMDLRRKNVVNIMVSDYVDKNRPGLQKDYPDFDTFDKEFTLNAEFMMNFLKVAEKEGVKFNEKEYTLSEELIKSQIKSLIAQKLWDINASYRIINEYDKEVLRALEVIKDDALFDK